MKHDSGLITNVTAKLPGDWGQPSRPRSAPRTLVGEMNGDEARYASELASRQLAGEIAAWAFQPFTFRLADRTTYRPDFAVLYADGAVEMIEIKGYLEDDASVKFKVAREKFPTFRWRMLRWKGGRWLEVLKQRKERP